MGYRAHFHPLSPAQPPLQRDPSSEGVSPTPTAGLAGPKEAPVGKTRQERRLVSPGRTPPQITQITGLSARAPAARGGAGVRASPGPQPHRHPFNGRAGGPGAGGRRQRCGLGGRVGRCLQVGVPARLPGTNRKWMKITGQEARCQPGGDSGLPALSVHPASLSTRLSVCPSVVLHSPPSRRLLPNAPPVLISESHTLPTPQAPLVAGHQTPTHASKPWL